MSDAHLEGNLSMASGSPDSGSPHSAVATLREWVASMNQRAPQERRTRLVAALREMQSAALGPKDGLDVVLAADLAWRLLAVEILRRYRLDSSVVRSSPEQFHAQMGEIGRLFGEIYAMYAGLPLPNAGAEASSGEQRRQVTARALFHFGKYTRWLISNRERSESSTWRSLHDLYQLSVREGFDARPLLLFQDEETVSTCGQLWLRTVMLGTLNTGNLSPRQIDRAEQWLASWCTGISVDDSYDAAGHLYCVDLAGDMGPARIIPEMNMVRPVFLRTTQLYGELVAARLHYLEESLASSLGLYATNPLREYLDLLDQMQRMWTAAAAHVQGRASARKDAPEGMFADVAQGMAAILSIKDDADRGPAHAMRWNIREYSERGLGVVGPQEGPDAPLNRQVIALRWKDSEDWQIGVIVRTMNQQMPPARQAGVRILARSAIVLSLSEVFTTATGASPQGSRGPRAHIVFFLAGNERFSQADSLLCLTGTLIPKMRLAFTTAKNEFVIGINRVIEGSGDWQRVGFQILEKRALGAGSGAGVLPARLRRRVPGLDVRPASTQPVSSSGAPGDAEDPLLMFPLFELDEPEKKEKSVAEMLADLESRYAGIAAAIEAKWGTIDCEKYLDKLILDDRGSRQGFPEPVMSVLLALYARHTREFSFPAQANTGSED